MTADTDQTQGIDPTITGDDRSDTRLPQAVLKSSTTKSPTAATELLRAETRNVQGETVSLEHSGAEQITAERAIVSNSGARSVQARSAQFDRSGVLSLHADKVVLQESSAVSVIATSVRLVRTKALFVKADSISGDPDSRVLVAGGSDAMVRPVVSSTGAAAAGAAFAVVWLILGRLVGRRRS